MWKGGFFRQGELSPLVRFAQRRTYLVVSRLLFRYFSDNDSIDSLRAIKPPNLSAMEGQLVRYLLGFAAISGLVFLIYNYLLSLTRLPNAPGATFWKSQPWVGLKKEMFSQLRASFRSVKHSQSMVDEGYAKVGPYLTACQVSARTTILTESAPQVLQIKQAFRVAQYGLLIGDHPAIAAPHNPEQAGKRD